MSIPSKRASLQRIPKAAGYALNGIAALYQREAAFRQEVWVLCFTIPASAFLHPSGWTFSLMLICSGLILITEAFNSALEALIDYLAPAHHSEAGYIKDIGSAAVFIAFILWGISWVILLFHSVKV